MKTPGDNESIEGLQVVAFISRLFESGASPQEIESKLIAKGLDPQEAAALTQGLVAYETKKKIRARVAISLAQATPPEIIEADLAREGFDPAVVVQEVRAIVEERASEEKARKDDPGPAIRILGVLLIIIGGALYIGNRTGAFATFPFAGGITMGLGALILAFGQYRASSN